MTQCRVIVATLALRVGVSGSLNCRSLSHTLGMLKCPLRFLAGYMVVLLRVGCVANSGRGGGFGVYGSAAGGA